MTKPAARTRHGLNAVRNRIAIRGLAIVDKRCAGAKALFEWKNELLNDLGGEENVSTQKRTLVELAVRTRLYVDHVDSFLLEQPSLINKRKRAILPIVRERQALVDSLARLLSQLGLDRQAKKVEDLDQYLERRGKELEAEKEKDDEAKPEAVTDDH